MASITAPPLLPPHIPLSRIFSTGLLAIVAAVLANKVVRFITVILFSIDPAFGPLQLMTPIVFTAIGVLGGVIVFAILSRTVQQPVRVFRTAAFVALLVSLIPDVLLLFVDPTTMPGLTVPGVIGLSVMHVVAWAITVSLLARSERT